MAIRVKLDHLLLDRRLTLTELADRIGITIASLSSLKKNKARAIRFSTLEALCRELECQPGDLLEWTADELGGSNRNVPAMRSTAARGADDNSRSGVSVAGSVPVSEPRWVCRPRPASDGRSGTTRQATWGVVNRYGDRGA